MLNKLFDISIFNYEYASKEAFWLFILLPLIVFWYLLSESSKFKNINISSLDTFVKKSFNYVAFFRHLNLFVLLGGLSFVILALARPHSPQEIEEYKKKNMEGIDIVMALDASGSMRAMDFKPNRLEAAKEVGIEFIKERPADRIGLVVFQAEAYTQSPLTTDHELLIQLFQAVQNSDIITDGTAIGLGLSTCINRLLESDAKSKVIILLTDGVNTVGTEDPMQAALAAKENSICIYTIGVGQDGTAPYPVETPFGQVTQQMPVEIDEELLTEIAGMTGGKYYRAKSKKELETIYAEIDLLEKSKVKALEYKVSPPEKFYGLLFIGLVLIFVNRIVQHTFLKSIP